jgi:hypothetical protein
MDSPTMEQYSQNRIQGFAEKPQIEQSPISAVKLKYFTGSL